jgi:hypothetical protein
MIACAAALCALMTLFGCGGNPTQPTLPPPSTPAASASTGFSGALSIPVFTISGWYASGTFHYVPKLTLAASADGALTVQVVNFKAHEGDFFNLAGIRYVSPPPRIPAGGTLDLMNDPRRDSTPDMTSPTALPTIAVVVTASNDAGQTETVTEVAQVPAISQDTAVPSVVIQAFTVTGWKTDRYFHYWPKLTLAETSGVGRVLVRKMTFELLDVGPNGRVAPAWDVGYVPAGGRLTLDADDYDGPWFEIFGEADVSRVSVTINFVDDAGRAGALTAVADVSPR